MTSPLQPRNSAMFYFQAWISFAVSMAAVGIGIAYLPVSAWVRGFFAVGALYLVTSSFTLAKVIRDRQETEAVVNRVDQARLEQLLTDHNIFRPESV
ncbi:YiaA/YiaB family inner membrane protein [Yinghuangia seranimata]|uniref:YiaA/YiaB family inner membrane protein n=1 Tax=Yinghuangia seranimata TaxID=408067 RepID=UPI00248CCED8|nr:YiaA/YiaB family inner membrane protein [Yinghuangia seranimata]MDI2130002.1 YiaA/YiaB family inner membrane protein [Yinghuangia seranimata]